MTSCDRRLLKLSDSPISSIVYEAAGPVLANTAKLIYHKAEAGKTYAVKLTPASPLRVRPAFV